MTRKLPADELARRKKLQKRQQTLIHMASVRGVYTDVARSRAVLLDEGEELIVPEAGRNRIDTNLGEGARWKMKRHPPA